MPQGTTVPILYGGELKIYEVRLRDGWEKVFEDVTPALCDGRRDYSDRIATAANFVC